MNENCLEGMSCPVCGNQEPFEICGSCWFLVFQDGVDEPSEVEWDDSSPCRCPACGHTATVGYFMSDA